MGEVGPAVYARPAVVLDVSGCGLCACCNRDSRTYSSSREARGVWFFDTEPVLNKHDRGVAANQALEDRRVVANVWQRFRADHDVVPLYATLARLLGVGECMRGRECVRAVLGGCYLEAGGVYGGVVGAADDGDGDGGDLGEAGGVECADGAGADYEDLCRHCW